MTTPKKAELPPSPDAHAALIGAADALIAAFGGNTPDWLQSEAQALAAAAEHARADLRLRERIARLEAAIRVSRAKFAEFAAYQRAKHDPSADAKAIENEALVAQCDTALFPLEATKDLRRRLAEIRNVAVICRERFQLYALSHQKRGGDEHLAKAQVNVELAAMLAAALAL